MSVNSMGPGISVAELKNMTAIRMAQQTQSSHAINSHRINVSNPSVLSCLSSEFQPYGQSIVSSDYPGKNHHRESSGTVSPHDAKKYTQYNHKDRDLIGFHGTSSKKPLIHGLTVEELKELTKLRLQTQNNASAQKGSISVDQSMRRVASMPYSRNSLMKNPNDAQISKSKYVRKNTAPLNQLRKELNSCNELTDLTYDFNERLDLDLHTPENEVITPIYLSNNSPANEFIPLQTPPKTLPNILSDTNGQRYPRESFSLGGGSDQLFDKTLTPLPVNNDSKLLLERPLFNDGYEYFTEDRELARSATMDEWLNASNHYHREYPKLKNHASVPHISVAKLDQCKNSHRKPAHLRINSSDAFPSNGKLAHLRIDSSDLYPMSLKLDDVETERVIYSGNDTDEPTSDNNNDLPSARAFIPTQVAEFALLTPVNSKYSKEKDISLEEQVEAPCTTVTPDWLKSSIELCDQNIKTNENFSKERMAFFNSTKDLSSDCNVSSPTTKTSSNDKTFSKDYNSIPLSHCQFGQDYSFCDNYIDVYGKGGSGGLERSGIRSWSGIYKF
mmetsp:Transcript_14787/g.20988  ORF Transcript_14787/g.20988 Transcript_14787/m.20988 type:complete len:558 (-) Transcript_14787:308-1981(-)